MSITVTIGTTEASRRQKDAAHVTCEGERASSAVLWRAGSAVPVVLSQVLASPQAAVGALHGALRRLNCCRRCRQRARQDGQHQPPGECPTPLAALHLTVQYQEHASASVAHVPQCMLASESSCFKRGKAGVGGVALPSMCFGGTHQWWDERVRGGPEGSRSCFEGLVLAAGAPKPVPHCMKKDCGARSLSRWSSGSVDLAFCRKLETCMQR